MDIRIYVGNLPYKTTDDELKAIFMPYGDVIDATIIRYRESKRSKGYAFIIMKSEDATKAIAALNEEPFMERPLKITVAKERVTKTIRIGID